MPTLNWIGKDAVVDHHRRVPLRLLECDLSLSAGGRRHPDRIRSPRRAAFQGIRAVSSKSADPAPQRYRPPLVISDSYDGSDEMENDCLQRTRRFSVPSCIFQACEYHLISSACTS